MPEAPDPLGGGRCAARAYSPPHADASSAMSSSPEAATTARPARLPLPPAGLPLPLTGLALLPTGTPRRTAGRRPDRIR
ncbi:hypothetical protein ACIBKZ_13875 [Streptomyces sp. NPDC050421]|uniref:hypothetical protein n=1 Tax=Streptomyces sp. NPDC050421 TaxID=3365613 RepID=UPI0037B8423A